MTAEELAFIAMVIAAALGVMAFAAIIFLAWLLGTVPASLCVAAFGILQVAIIAFAISRSFARRAPQ